VPIVENGYLFLFDEDAAVAAAAERVEMQHGVGLADVELLDGPETERRFPFVDAGAVRGATWCPSDGFLRPEVVYGEAAASARTRGVRILQNAPVTEARHAGGRLTAVKAGGTWLEADLFVDATNAWSARLAPILGATMLPVLPIKRHLWFLVRGDAMTAAELSRLPMVISPKGAYCHPENADTLMCGWALPVEAEPDFSDADQDRILEAFDHRGGPDSFAFETWLALAEVMPSIGEFAGIQATTCGFYGVTPDHNPFLGFDTRVPNLLRLVGFSGHGAMFGPFTARVAEVLADAGAAVPSVTVLGRSAGMAPFALDRGFHGHEAMVI
ncbi:MAG: FAD-binding oxidoreductase, partial [Myxococcota bacterium]|nr:FAD-binding oxidoreductase [Myxococcota bacterium]